MTQFQYIKLFNEYTERLTGYAMRIVGRIDVAEDMVAEAFINVWKGLEKYSIDKSNGWLYIR